MRASPLDVYSDELLGLALAEGQPIPERLAGIEAISPVLDDLVIGSWADEPEHCSKVIRAASILACRPSLEVAAQGGKHTLQTAAEVSDNLRLLSRKLLDSYDLHPQRIADRTNEQVVSEYFGQLSEMAVLGLGWHGIEKGYREPTTYFLPATKKEDAGNREIDGLNLATDIFAKEVGKERQPIQVKNTGSTLEIDDYYIQIAIVAVSRLMREEGSGRPRELLRLLADDDVTKLRPMHSRLWAKIYQAEARVAAKKAQDNPPTHRLNRPAH